MVTFLQQLQFYKASVQFNFIKTKLGLTHSVNV